MMAKTRLMSWSINSIALFWTRLSLAQISKSSPPRPLRALGEGALHSQKQRLMLAPPKRLTSNQPAAAESAKFVLLPLAVLCLLYIGVLWSHRPQVDACAQVWARPLGGGLTASGGVVKLSLDDTMDDEF